MRGRAMAEVIPLPLACTLVMLTSSPACALEASSDKLQFEVTPYLFGASLSGSSGVANVTADVDMSFSDIVDHLDSGFMAAFEARKGALGFAADGMYLRIKDERTQAWQGESGARGPTGELEATMTEQLYQLTAMYRVLDAGTTLDALVAGRYTKLDTDLDLVVSGVVLPGGTRSVSGSNSWWDPVVGMRASIALADNWALVGYADVGGFGVGSDLTYQAIVAVHWQLSTTFIAKLGYRYFDQDYKDGGFVWDMAAQGVCIGLGIRF